MENAESQPQEPTAPVAAPQENYSLQLIEQERGWGFEIYRDSAVFIRQPHIPAVEGNRPFATKNDAGQVGALMILKLQKGIIPPSVSLEELDSLGIKH